MNYPLSVQKVAKGACLLDRAGVPGYYFCQFPPCGDGKTVSYLINCDGNEAALVRHFVGVNEKAALEAVDLYLSTIMKVKGK